MQLFNLCLFFFEGTCQGLILWLSLTKRVSWRQGHFLNLISDRRAVCTGALELSCTFYPELFPPTILCNHLCVLLRLCDLTQHSYYQGQQSKKKKKITNFYSKTGITVHTGNMINENVREPWKKYDLEPYIFYWQTDDSWFEDYCISLTFKYPSPPSVVQDVMFIYHSNNH